MPSAFCVLGCRRAKNQSQGLVAVKRTWEELLPRVSRDVARGRVMLHESSPGRYETLSVRM